MKKILLILMTIILISAAVVCKVIVNEETENTDPSSQPTVNNTTGKDPEKDKTMSLVVTGNSLLGAYKDGKWVNSKESESLITGKEKFAFFAISKPLGSGINAKMESFEGGNAIKIERDFNVTANNDSFYKYFIREIGISGGWNALPRVPEALSKDNVACQDSVKAVLAKKGIENSKIDIKRITRIDFDGDGNKEEVITATDYNLEAPGKAIGSYSVVIIRKFAGGSIENIIVKEQNVKEKPEYEYVFDCPLILDIDKDGVMELIIESRYGACSKIEFCKVIKGNIEVIYTTQFGA